MSKAMDTNTNTSYVNPNTDNNGNSNSNRNSNSINNKEPQKSFEEQANWFSRIFLIYLDKLFKKGAEQQLTLEDLGPTTQLDTAKVVYTKFETLWKDECQLPKEKRSLWKVMWRTITYWKLFLSILLYSVYTAQSFIPPIILNLLVSHFEGDKLNTATLWILVVLIFILPITGAIFYVASNVLLAHLGVRFRNALIVMIYRKALRLAPSARQSASTGQIVNMFANDTTQLQRFLFFLNFVLLALPTIAVALALIYQQVGVATFVGLGLIIILIPVNGVIFGALNMLRTRKVGFTDIRVKLMNEILNGIRVIKFYAWEFAFKDKVEEIRAKELDALRKIAYIVSVGFTIILTAAPLMLPVLIFYTYTALGNQLDAAKAFTTISFFNIMQFPFAFLPLGLAQYSQAEIAMRRMLTFLMTDELDPYVNKEEKDDGVVVSMTNASLGWLKEPTPSEIEKEQKEKEEQKVADNDKNKKDTSTNPSTITDKKKSTKEPQSIANDDEELGNRLALKDSNDAGRGGKRAGDYEAVEISPDTVSAGLKSDSHNYDGVPTNEDQETVTPTDVALVEQEEEPTINRSEYTLESINFQIKKGQLVAIVGPVGCGKSSLLSAILGEMHMQAGEVQCHGSIAYCDQRPWILNATVKENVLFGMPYDERKFDVALYAANLEDDIKVLPGGVHTQIGERGINLSGGQKARVALARAIYRDADVFLLDDPLSAVDAHVGRFIFNECIKDQLKDKTVLLVTHQVQLLSECDQIIIMEEAKVKAVGTYEELTQSGLDIQSYIPQYNAEREGENESEGTRETDSPVLQEIVPKEDEEEKEMSESKQEDISSKRMMKEASVAAAKVRKEDNRSSNITSKEEQSEGDVPFRVYMKYIRAGGITTFAFMCLFVLIQQAFQVLSYFWLQYWGTRSDSAEQNNNDLSTSRNLWYLRIFALLSFLSLVANMIRALCLADHRIRTSSILHSNLLVNTLGGSIAFFDVTPIGRILNRFSSDMDVVDEQLAQTIAQLTSSFGSVLSAVGGIIGATKGFFMILLVPLVWFYFRVQKFFRKSNTAIARLEAISRSPIYADFSQALSGLSSLRAYGDQERFIDNLERSIDSNSIANVMQQLASSWLSLRLDLIGASVSFFIAALAAGASGFIPAGFVAVGLSYSFQLTSFLKFFLRMVSTFEANMSSIERIQYYVDSVPQEGLPDKELPLSEISKDWPQTGSIRGEKVDLRYRDGPLVLKDLSFDIKPMEKIGVAGRTGSGKSSTMIAIYRMQELAGGAIYIDNVDISTIPLQLLRSKLGIIPQDPVMFSASVRFNLDPFLEHTDTEIWNILDSIHLKDHILSLPHKLEEYVAEGGDNFSAGQRQLICIGRAILRKPKILILDEATASIDNDTDNLVQEMIRKEFKDCTVLTIAHRLHTIYDSDRIMIMDDGSLAEMDAPQALLALPNGVFRSLWEKHQRQHGGISRTGSTGHNLANKE